MRFLLILLTFVALAIVPVQADAKDRNNSVRKEPVLVTAPRSLDQHRPRQQNARPTQSNGMSLAQAVESVRRRTNGKIVGAETRVSGGREVHHIKVLLKDGTVKTHKVNGRRR